MEESQYKAWRVARFSVKMTASGLWAVVMLLMLVFAGVPTIYHIADALAASATVVDILLSISWFVLAGREYGWLRTSSRAGSFSSSSSSSSSTGANNAKNQTEDSISDGISTKNGKVYLLVQMSLEEWFMREFRWVRAVQLVLSLVVMIGVSAQGHWVTGLLSVVGCLMQMVNTLLHPRFRPQFRRGWVLVVDGALSVATLVSYLSSLGNIYWLPAAVRFLNMVLVLSWMASVYLFSRDLCRSGWNQVFGELLWVDERDLAE